MSTPQMNQHFWFDQAMAFRVYGVVINMMRFEKEYSFFDFNIERDLLTPSLAYFTLDGYDSCNYFIPAPIITKKEKDYANRLGVPSAKFMFFQIIFSSKIKNGGNRKPQEKEELFLEGILQT